MQLLREHAIATVSTANNMSIASIAEQSNDTAGGVATETPLERVDLPDGSSNANAAAYAATVQLPLESGLVGALSFVVHAPGGRWVACNRGNSRQDFFFSLSPVRLSSRPPFD